jgi:hypothetical protein
MTSTRLSRIVSFLTDSLLALLIMGQSRPWSDRYLFSAFNAFQRI